MPGMNAADHIATQLELTARLSAETRRLAELQARSSWLDHAPPFTYALAIFLVGVVVGLVLR